VLKSRGMAHSNEVHEFALTDSGLQVLDAAGAAREASPTRDMAADRRPSS
jgi:hypothetical protein